MQPLTNRLTWRDVRRIYLSGSNLSKIQHCSFSLCTWYIVQMHAACGLFSWGMELLALASRQFVLQIVDLSVCFIASHFFFFLVSERSGRRKPSAERSALCTRMYHVICSSLPCRLLLVEQSVWMARHPLYVASLEFGHLTLKSCRRRCCWCCWCWLIRAVHRRMFVSCRFGLMCLYRFS